uniref:Uncharacterized protein n=1 Tax=Corethron hystrix TaxID=216773 RepID=A0A7S1G2X7_9STRA|mmetsp:Transcript_7547/g.16362  ORF Transcript_7547/g.16362 Transcript_7547/m.16362 type:complete len:178 (+) Transcript_7547:102-635(+)
MTGPENISISDGTEDIAQKEYKICSVIGGVNVVRIVSFNNQRFFESTLEDVELIRETVSWAAAKADRNVIFPSYKDLRYTLDWRRRGLEESTTTVEAGLAYTDDRSDRAIERYVSLANEPFVGDKESDSAFICKSVRLQNYPKYKWIRGIGRVGLKTILFLSLFHYIKNLLCWDLVH